MAFYLSHGFRDFNGILTAKAEVEKLKGEHKLSQSLEKKLAEEIRA